MPTSEARGMKTVYPREFITCFKVVHNDISDNFYRDQYTVRSDLKNCVRSKKGDQCRENSAKYEVYHMNISCLKYNF